MRQEQLYPWRAFVSPLVAYAVTSVLAIAGTHLDGTAAWLLNVAPRHGTGPGRLFGNDGGYYLRIADQGYSYQPFRQSDIAFFPAFPMLGRAVSAVFGIRADTALVVVSHVSLAAASVFLAKYVAAGPAPALANPTVLLCLVWPTSFFFRMAYSESLFLCLMILTMYGLRVGWPRIAVAAVIGCATAARPVGLALLAPFVWTLWQDWKEQQKGPAVANRSTGAPIDFAPAAGLIAVSVWGLAAFMAYQAAAFGEPLAFVKAQNYWAVRQADSPIGELSSLASLSAMVDVYTPGSSAYWRRFDQNLPAWLSLQFANPIYFVTAAALCGWGWLRGWLDDRESLLGLFLLMIPYVAHGFESAMTAHGRYAAVVFPAYIALAHAVQHAPAWVRRALYCVCAGLLLAYAALFAGGYRMV
jgi:hypothetical protein